MTGHRLDAALVHGGLARSRGEAIELIKTGVVAINDVVARRPARRVNPTDRLAVARDGPAWVGRGARKLITAFEAFGAVSPAPWTVVGRRCLDVGASTGGFTQVLLDRGAAEVVALDVGRDQLAAAVRAHPRVRDVPGRSVRGIDPAELGGPFEVVVVDLSFISLQLVAADVAALLTPAGQAVLLVKPQFEIGRSGLGKNGLVRSPEDRAATIRGVSAAYRDVGLFPRAVEPTAFPGSTGNHEYLVWVTTRADLALPDDDAAAIAAVRRFEG